MSNKREAEQCRPAEAEEATDRKEAINRRSDSLERPELTPVEERLKQQFLVLEDFDACVPLGTLSLGEGLTQKHKWLVTLSWLFDLSPRRFRSIVLMNPGALWAAPGHPWVRVFTRIGFKNVIPIVNQGNEELVGENGSYRSRLKWANFNPNPSGLPSDVLSFAQPVSFLSMRRRISRKVVLSAADDGSSEDGDEGESDMGSMGTKSLSSGAPNDPKRVRDDLTVDSSGDGAMSMIMLRQLER